MIDYVKLGDKIELVTELDALGRQEHYYSCVQGREDNVLTISAPMTKGRIEPLELHRTYGMCVYTSNGLYRCEVELISRENRDNLFLLNIKIKGSLQKYQRREYYRMDCVLQFHFKDANSDTWYNAVILDISGGGIRFFTRERLKEQDEIINHIILEFNDKKYELYLNGKIIGAERNSESGDVNYEIRESFDNISEDDRELIIKYIFDAERRRRRNKVR